MTVRSISITAPLVSGVSNGEELIVYCARVSSPKNQHNHATGAKLLRYCIEHGHWSVFEMVDWTVEVTTSRAIAAQILRHRSFSFQEFSQRYSTVDKVGDIMQPIEMRPAAAGGNRQGSDELEPLRHPNIVRSLVANHLADAECVYRRLLDEGVAPECARMILPLATTTKLYMKGSVRSWIHYLQVRCDGHTQKEHRDIAEVIKGLFRAEFPNIAEAVWGSDVKCLRCGRPERVNRYHCEQCHDECKD